MQLQLTTRDRERFESKVDRSGGQDACHPWVGYCNQDGYGRFSVGGRRGRMERAHRVAWVLAGNEITPEKPHILHDCPDGDLPACCNDRHLWDGTNLDNSRDRDQKGRGRGPKSKRGMPFGVRPRAGGRFGSEIKINGKSRWFGTYDTPEEAAAVAAAEKARHLAAVGCAASPSIPPS